MERSLSLLPPLHLDGKRIAATSVAIAVHAAVLMVLMLPMRAPPSPALEDASMIVVPIFTPRPIPPPPRPLAPTPPAPTPPRPVAQPPQAQAVDSTPSPSDPYLPPTPPQDQVLPPAEPPATPVFAQISADRAPPPPYPAQALRRHIGGVVMLRLRVAADGRPLAGAVETSSGSKVLDDAALKFVLARWHFVPARQDGHAVEAEALVPINFVPGR